MVKRAGGALLLSISIDPDSRRPVSIQLYVALRDLILSGGFAVGERLPASRTLARQLGLSRTTVIDAFDRLTAEGLIESRVGAGAFVSRALEAERPRPQGATAGPAVQPPPARLSRAMTQAVSLFAERRRLPSAARAFTTALPAFEAFPMAQWARLAARHWRGSRNDVMGYGEPFGHPALRQAIALHLRANRGIGYDAEQIFIVGGAQQAFHLIGLTLLDPGDKVWFENPGAIGARNSLIASGAELVPVPVDEHGLRVAEGLRLSPQFRLAFVTPSHQQPLGTVMSLERRFALLHAAEQAGAWIIEDDYDGEFSFGGPPLPTLKSVDTTGLVIYVGTFSKSLFPSLRLGYVLAPPALVAELDMGLGARAPAPDATARCQARDCCSSTSASTVTPASICAGVTPPKPSTRPRASIGAMAKRSIGETVILRCSAAATTRCSDKLPRSQPMVCRPLWLGTMSRAPASRACAAWHRASWRSA